MSLLPIDILLGLLINPKIGTKNQIICDCVFCGREKHMYINKGYSVKGIEHGYDCKKCGKSGNIVTLLQFLGKLELLEGRDVDIKKPLPTLKKLNQTVEEEIDIEVKTIKLPIGFKKLKFSDDNKYSEYLRQRKFTELDFEIYQPGYTWKSKLKDYVIIPITREYEVKGYVARYIGDDENKPRYLNSQDSFSKLLMGYDEIAENTKTVILVEGSFDKVGVTTELDLHNQEEIKCLASFGKKISDCQLYLLQIAGIENIFLCFDGRDAIKDIKNIGFKIKNQFKNILCCDTGFKFDPASSDKNMLLNILNEAKPVHQFQLDKLSKLKLK